MSKNSQSDSIIKDEGLVTLKLIVLSDQIRSDLAWQRAITGTDCIQEAMKRG